MTTLTLEEQRKLAEKVTGNKYYTITPWMGETSIVVSVNSDDYGFLNRMERDAVEWYPHLTAPDGRMRLQALAVLEAYSKTIEPQECYASHAECGIKILEALRTGDLDPIARELIQ